MKRRLPTINQDESVLVAISLPPHTAETNRHGPSVDQPGAPNAARHAAAIAARAPAPTSTGELTAGPPNSTANAANAAA